MTERQLIKKAEKAIALLKEIAQHCEEQIDNTPYSASRKQETLREACFSVHTISKNTAEELKSTLDYYCNYFEGYEWTK